MWLFVVNWVSLIILTRTGLSSGSTCSPYMFDCENGRCIAELWRCDGYNDCGNLKDEHGCEEYRPALRCFSSQFACESGENCIPLKWYCDGGKDCEDGSDEKNCDNATKKCTGFTCRSHQCIPEKWRCDGNRDCKDGSDEEQCPQAKLCTDSEFLCSSGSCVNLTLLCDGKKDCVDGSDEGSHCPDHCENATCSQNCRSTPSGPECFCNDGYMLYTKDNKTCLDVDECLEEGFCSHHCTNIPGGYKCSCQNGYELVNRTCKAKGGDPLLIFSTLKDIRAVRLRKHEYFLVRRAVSQATTLDVDPKSQHIYWIELSNKSSIMSAKTDGTAMKTVISHGLQIPEDIAVDYVANNLYLTDSGLRKVLVCKIDGTMCHVLHDKNVEKPRSIVLDLTEGLLYWSDWGERSAGIYRSGMDGSRRIPLVSSNIAWPNGIALDHTTNRLYWADAKLKTIEYISLNGSSRRVLLNETLFEPYSVAVFEDNIYWTDWSSFALESCNKFTGHRMTELAKENGRHIMGLHVYHPVLIANVVNPCWSSGCSHLCLISPGSGFRCACPLGFQLADDERTCKMDEITEAIFVSEGSSVFYIRPGAVGKETINEMSLPLSTAMISKVAFDKNLRFLFVADISSPAAIHAVNMTSLKMKVLVRNGIITPEDLSFDWRSNNLYWIDSGKQTLEVISVDSLKRAVILEGLSRPVALAISPTNGHMFVATLSRIPRVTMYDMDGSIMKVLGSVEGLPMSLALHPTKSILYWADPNTATISYVNYTRNGSPRTLDFKIDGFISVAVSEEYIYWTNEKRELHYTKGGTVLVLQLPGEEKGIVVRKVTYISSKTSGAKSGCMIGNGGCGYICLTSSKGKTCACPPELMLAEDNATCIAKRCEVGDFKCMDGQCLPAELRCDGNKNCEDGSDEIECSRCPGSDFQCKNGQCIEKSWHCDGRTDCSDHSDEEGCSPKACVKDQITCLNGECVSMFWRCDGDKDCQDGSDETNCTVTRCGDNHFRCNNGQCISIAWVCDRSNDCFDNSDERNCSFAKTCSVHEFRCDVDGTCIDEMMKCDGRANCEDGADELNCPSTRTECKEGMYKCKDGHCIYDYEVCDGHEDCNDKEDELNCSDITCHRDSYFCASSNRCILPTWICDGSLDCSDGSDEENCGKNPIKPKPTQAPIDSQCDGFFCFANHRCLPWSQVCDGHQDCENLSDEGGLCSKQCGRNNGGCSHSCWKTPYGSRCSCNHGYSLNPDNKTCEDVDECQMNGSCSHYCENTKGGFKCSCADGYILHNHRHCKVDGGPATLVYLLGDQIRGYDLVNRKYKVYIKTKTADIKGMDYDPVSDVFFWTEEKDGSINSYSPRTKEQKMILKSSSRPRIIRYDWIANNLYYKDKSSSIVVCSVDGKYCKTIIQSSNTNIESMDISPTDGLMFWTVWANSYRGFHSGQIERAEMDGSHRRVMLANKLIAPTGLTIDHVLKLIYWSDKQLSTLECMDFNGFGRRQVVESKPYHPFAVAIFEDDVYWADWGSDSIITCNKFTGENCTDLIKGDVAANVLMIVHNATKPKGENKCQNNSCMQLCILTRSNYECVCDDRDNGTCGSTLLSVASSSPVETMSAPSSSLSRVLYNTKSSVDLSSATTSGSGMSSKSPLSLECPKDYCQDGSECVEQNGEFVCKCSPYYSGKTCEVKAAASISTYNHKWIIALVFGLVMTVVIIAGILLCIRNREKLQSMGESVSVKFCSPKNGSDSRLVMDTDDGSLCEELVGQEKECRRPTGESDYCVVDGEDSDLRKWPPLGRDSSLINHNVVNFFRKLKLNASSL